MNCCDFPMLADSRIVIRSQTLADDGYGGQTLTWTTAATVWAWIKPIADFNVSEQKKQDQLQSVATYEVVIRYNSSFKSVRDFASYSMVFDGRAYSIINIRNFDHELKNYGTEFQKFLVVDNGPELLGD